MSKSAAAQGPAAFTCVAKFYDACTITWTEIVAKCTAARTACKTAWNMNRCLLTVLIKITSHITATAGYSGCTDVNALRSLMNEGIMLPTLCNHTKDT